MIDQQVNRIGKDRAPRLIDPVGRGIFATCS
jgi:hypothetical protein